MGDNGRRHSIGFNGPPDRSRVEACKGLRAFWPIGGLTSGLKPLRWGNAKLRRLLASVLDYGGEGDG
jgi:hypothetical protein